MRDTTPLEPALPPVYPEVPDGVQKAQEARLREAWKPPPGWRYWSAVNNTIVGLWYVVLTFLFFIFGGVLALLMRIQLARSSNSFLDADTYNQVFTVHGSVMMFLFAIPIFESLAILFLPQMLGARDLPFPRISAFGFWCFLLGGLFLCGSLFFDAAPRGGWFMYPPLSSSYQPGVGADIWLLGFSFIELAAIAAAVELIVGVLKCRPPGMRINLMPVYAWYVLVAAVMVIFAFPPLIAGSLLLEIERAFNWPFFDPTRGGDPLLWQHLFWLFGHPEVYIIFLPSVALLAMIVPTFARRPIVGYSWVVLSAVGTGFLSFGLWVHHMFTTGLPSFSLALFSAASQAVAIPTGIQLFCFLGTLAAGRRVSSLPMLWVFGSLAIFVAGGLTGVMLALVPFNLQAHDTFFVVGHFHYVLIGGALFPIVAGCYYFYPLIHGKQLSARQGKIAFWLTFTGFNLTFFPMHILGLQGMPRRIFTYSAETGWDSLNLLCTVGAFVLATGLGVFFWDLFRPKGGQPTADRNPWSAGTLEWLSTMPGPNYGVRCIPIINSRNPLWDQSEFVRHYDQGRFFLPDAEEGKRETLVTTVLDARPLQCLRLPGPSFLPFWSALTIGGMFIFGTFHWWWLAAASGIAGLLVTMIWLWTGTAIIPEKSAKEVAPGIAVPLYGSGSASVGWWAMCIVMLADLTAFVCLVFGYFFFWTVHHDFPPTPSSPLCSQWMAGGVVLTLGSWALTLMSHRCNRRNTAHPFYLTLILATGLALAGGMAMLFGPWKTGLDPQTHVYPAIVWALAIWTAVHIGLGVVMQLYCLARRWAGRMTAQYDIDLGNVVLYWHFTLLTAVITGALVGGFPLLR
jgi:cytochrome c oxidase subunit I+III